MNFAEEKILDLRSEIQPLLEQHYEEIAWNKDRIPLNVDWDRYAAVEALGKFVAYTARINGELVGYSAYIIDNHLHYKSTVFANNDVLYIRKDMRGNGKVFIRWCEDQLKKRGAHVHGLHIKKWFDWSPMAIRMGFEHMDGVFMRWIG